MVIKIKKKNMTTVKFLSAGALVLSIVGYTMYNNSAKPSHNQKAETAIAKTAALPDFVLKNEKGVALNLNSFKGKKVFVNLWATWCGPCRREMPSI